MLPVQPYHEGSYPPGAKFPQFGDDVIGGYLNAHAALAEKRRNMVPFHIGRLQEDGLVPMNMETHTPTPRRDPEGELIDDRPPAPPPLPPRGRGRLRRREPEREGPMIRYGPSVIISEPVPGADQHYIGSETEGAMGGLTSAIASVAAERGGDHPWDRARSLGCVGCRPIGTKSVQKLCSKAWRSHVRGRR